jgi:hypothetical protein
MSQTAAKNYASRGERESGPECLADKAKYLIIRALNLQSKNERSGLYEKVN